MYAYVFCNGVVGTWDELPTEGSNALEALLGTI